MTTVDIVELHWNNTYIWNWMTYKAELFSYEVDKCNNTDISYLVTLLKKIDDSEKIDIKLDGIILYRLLGVIKNSEYLWNLIEEIVKTISMIIINVICFVSALWIVRTPAIIQLHARSILYFSLGSCQKVLPQNSNAPRIAAIAGKYHIYR